MGIEMSRLLAGRDRPSIVEKEAMFDAVMRGIAPRRRVRWPLGLGIAIPALAAIVLVATQLGRTTPRASELASRGTTSDLAALAVSCGACTSADRLVFDLHGTLGYRYFAAFSRRADGTVLWYFPATPTSSSVDLATQPSSGLLGVGITMGDAHPAGAYRVYGVFSHVALGRNEIRARFDPERPTIGPGTAVVVLGLDVP